ncbi:MAG TPA: aerial mycelium formation protein [Mycobacteriales bacterium]|jgi:hypothetical protein|nr:aerial mycelium formation protein [Mycobacteriales bacterium]
MSDVQPGGHRRIDRVLGSDFADGLAELPMPELRSRRHDVEQEEVDLSYLRRLLQGRIDILRAEQARRRSDGGTVIGHLTDILADERRDQQHGMGRHSTLEPSRAGEHRRRVEALVGDVDLSDAGALSDEDLMRALTLFSEEERSVSSLRSRVQHVMDALGAEVARRYRDGEAAVDDLLPGESH